MWYTAYIGIPTKQGGINRWKTLTKINAAAAVYAAVTVNANVRPKITAVAAETVRCVKNKV